MKFAEPSWLIAGLAIMALLLLLYRRFDRRQRAALAEFASSHLVAKLTSSFSPGRRRFKRALFMAAIAFTCVALARPQWGYHWIDEKERGIDILFAIDTSKSMLTQDVTPDRLTRAKLAITDFVRKLDGDRVGLIAFAGEAFLQAPLTLDYDAFQDTLDSIDVNTIPRGGTDISSAIEEAQAAFGKSQQNKKILVLITDGEDLEGSSVDTARAAAKDGLVIYTVGVGTASGGLIPVPNPNGGTDFVKDASGEYVKSHLDENTLTQIAGATGGIYEPLGQQGQGLGVIYDKALASMPKHELSSRRAKVYEERYEWPLAAGLVCLIASIMIGTRRRDADKGKPAFAGRAATAAAAILALMAIPTLARASAQSAESAYKKGDYTKAQSQYEEVAAQHPDVGPLQYDLGAASYKTGDFDTALPAFQKALGSDDIGVQQQAYYNMGNTQYRLGQKTEKSSPQDTIKQWQSAVQSYDAALKLKPDDADAKFNRDFVEKKLEKLQKQNPQKQTKTKTRISRTTTSKNSDRIRISKIRIRTSSRTRINRISRANKTSRINRRAVNRTKGASNSRLKAIKTVPNSKTARTKPRMANRRIRTASNNSRPRATRDKSRTRTTSNRPRATRSKSRRAEIRTSSKAETANNNRRPRMTRSRAVRAHQPVARAKTSSRRRRRPCRVFRAES